MQGGGSGVYQSFGVNSEAPTAYTFAVLPSEICLFTVHTQSYVIGSGRKHGAIVLGGGGRGDDDEREGELNRRRERESPAPISIARPLDPNSGSHRCRPQEACGDLPPGRSILYGVRSFVSRHLPPARAVVMATRLRAFVPRRRRRPSRRLSLRCLLPS